MIYLDYNSTTPIDPVVLEKMLPFLKDKFANANSDHSFGLECHRSVENARAQVADLIGADSTEIIFTSGATESINIALKGVAEYNKNGNHIITIKTEHPAVLDSCRYLESKGINVTYLPVERDGLINLKQLEEALRDDTILVSIMLANNETGVLQPIKEISNLLKSKGNIVFFSDCTQAVGKISVDVDSLGVDMICLSGHKMYGPKGVGALYIGSKEIRNNLIPLLHGGRHEFALRSGTLNVPGIVALGQACEQANKEMQQNSSKIKNLRDYLEYELLKIENTKLNGAIDRRLYNVSNICFKGVEASVLIGILKDVAVSNGAACSSATISPSHVLKAIGLSDDQALSSIRFSLGKYNSMDEINQVLDRIKVIIRQIRNHA